MIKSMTGFGKAVAEFPQKKVQIEIRSLNSKSLDLNSRLPWIYKEKEAEIRSILSQKLERGKVDLSISFDILDSEIIPSINKNVVRNYFQQMKEITDELDLKADDQLLSIIMRLPDTLKTEKPELPDDEWQILKEKISEAASQLDTYRISEGETLGADLKRGINMILSLLADIAKVDAGRIIKIREKLNASLEENVGKDKIDNNRFEQELIFYLEKLDINEEKVRLQKHCDYFLEMIDSPPPNGKILGFIAQEIGREINTIGSKANDAAIQKFVVMMKDELEKIKEQSLNVL